MERMWLSEAHMKYPKQWYVAVNVKWEQKNKLFGDIYLVTSNEGEAYAVYRELIESGAMGRVEIDEGFDDTPQIGGLEICLQ